ncbi:hypothetical protein QQ045_010432 [Rhodiola kirilowii]
MSNTRILLHSSIDAWKKWNWVETADCLNPRMLCATRVLIFPQYLNFRFNPLRRNRRIVSSSLTSRSPPRESVMGESGIVISLEEWQGWGSNGELLAMVTEIVEDLKAIEKDTEARVCFG